MRDVVQDLTRGSREAFLSWFMHTFPPASLIESICFDPMLCNVLEEECVLFTMVGEAMEEHYAGFGGDGGCPRFGEEFDAVGSGECAFLGCIVSHVERIEERSSGGMRVRCERAINVGIATT